MTLLEVANLRKTFPGVNALDGASLSVGAGELHALIGANGAGKSTLIKILAGLEHRDAGEISVDGEVIDSLDPLKSASLGLRFIHQHLALIPRLSIADNLTIANMPSRFGVVRRGQLRRLAQAAIADSLPGVDPRTPISALSVAQQWLVSLARVHVDAGRIVFLDEPTAALGAPEVEHLFATLRRLADAGIAVVFVSHRLDEVLDLTTTVTAMRGGRTVDSRPTETCDHSTLVRLITGHEPPPPPTAEIPDRPGAVVLEARELCSGPVRDVSIAVRAGEVLGLGGLVGSGRSELLETLFGARPIESGHIELDGRAVRLRSPADAIRLGIALLPEERHTMALFPRRSIRVNVVVSHLAMFARRAIGVMVPSRESATAGAMIERLGIKAWGPAQHVDELSGGNQQKVVVGRWLTGELRVFLVDEPTKGVDVDGKEEILRSVRALAASGVAVIITSSELDEVAAVADRVVVLREGRIAAHLDGPTSGAAVLAACFGNDTTRAA